MGQVQQLISQLYSEIPDPKFIGGDGSTHDANQHFELLDATDHKLYSLTLPHILGKGTFTPMDKHIIEKNISKNTFSFVAYYPFTRNIFMRGRITGTTFSGHPVRTTLGNSLRVWCYLSYLLQDIPERNYRGLIAGDDFLLIVSRGYARRVRAALEHGYMLKSDYDAHVKRTKTNPQVAYHGLGQVIKISDDLISDRIDFLSKQGFMIRG